MSDKEFELSFNPKPPPTDPAEIHFKNAWQHRKFKRYREAIDEFQKSLEHNPDKGATHLNMGLVYDQLNEGRLALAHAQKALALFETEQRPSNRDAAQNLLNRLARKYPDLASDTQKN
jgi:tetratricopeptide (TPR) repeat protein